MAPAERIEDDLRPLLEGMIMRTLGTLLVLALYAGAAGCGGGSGSSNYTSPTGRSPANGGQCPASSSGQTCTGEDAYYDCLIKACDAQSKACFGNSYLKGDFTGGVCADFMNCVLLCPCDATGDACVMNCTATYVMSATSTACMTCALTLQTCTETAGCVEPVCTTTGIDAGTPTTTGPNCAALQACCAVAPAAAAAQCQAALTAAAGDETTCLGILTAFQAQGLCL
jgi:hypothetical protein